MDTLLNINYAIQVKNKIKVNEKIGYATEDAYYFPHQAINDEAVYMEQAALAYYLMQRGFTETAIPIPNLYGQWITQKDGIFYIVMKANPMLERQENIAHGKRLYEFHARNVHYMYEPQYISSYGKWKELWIEKLSSMEERIFEEANKHLNEYYNIVADSLPYIIGISENAIAYLHETYYKTPYHLSDQGTITFLRYHDQLLQPILWMHELAYDHPSRDLAEYIRYQFLKGGGQMEKVKKFLKDYESNSPLSLYSWRLLYARLLYPIHLMDFIEKNFFKTPTKKDAKAYEQLLKKQPHYEQQVRELFSFYKQDRKRQIPMVQWL